MPKVGGRRVTNLFNKEKSQKSQITRRIIITSYTKNICLQKRQMSRIIKRSHIRHEKMFLPKHCYETLRYKQNIH